MEVTASGNLFTMLNVGSRQKFVKDLSEEFAGALQKAIIADFERSVQLAAMVGDTADQEALRTIYRSLKVKIKTYYPLELEAKFDDDYSHWYGGEEMPKEMADVLQEIIDTSIREWFNSEEPGNIIKKALVS